MIKANGLADKEFGESCVMFSYIKSVKFKKKIHPQQEVPYGKWPRNLLVYQESNIFILPGMHRLPISDICSIMH